MHTHAKYEFMKQLRYQIKNIYRDMHTYTYIYESHVKIESKQCISSCFTSEYITL